MSQKAAYYNTITSVLKENKVKFEENKTVVKDVLTKEMRDQVIGIIMTGFKAGKIPLKDTPANREKLADEAKLKEYTISTLNNWLLKDERFNGGVQHKIKNPGSRAGQGDRIVKNFQALQAQFPADSEQHRLLQTKIDARKQEVAAEKAKKSQREVDLSLIPEDLKKQLGLK